MDSDNKFSLIFVVAVLLLLAPTWRRDVSNYLGGTYKVNMILVLLLERCPQGKKEKEVRQCHLHAATLFLNSLTILNFIQKTYH